MWKAEKQKARPPCCFLSNKGMRKILSSKEEHRDVDVDKFNQVQRGSASDDSIAEASYFVFNSLFYGEPLQLLEKRFGVFCSMRFKDEFGCRVLYLLEWFDDCE